MLLLTIGRSKYMIRQKICTLSYLIFCLKHHKLRK
jgi:hypothetical protein